VLKNIIIGKRSNLSSQLKKSLDQVEIFSISEFIEFFNKEHDEGLNIFLNNFHPSHLLRDIENYSLFISNSILSTASILDCIKESKRINKIIYTSSSAVYGHIESTIEESNLSPKNLYSSLKIANEELIIDFCSLNNIPWVITRVFNMYGGNDKFSVVSKILSSIEDKKPITISNNGDSVRDFIHISDVVKIYHQIINKNVVGKINIGTGIGTSVKDLIGLIHEKEFEIEIISMKTNEIKTSIADMNKLGNILGPNFEYTDVREYIKNKLKS